MIKNVKKIQNMDLLRAHCQVHIKIHLCLISSYREGNLILDVWWVKLSTQAHSLSSCVAVIKKSQPSLNPSKAQCFVSEPKWRRPLPHVPVHLLCVKCGLRSAQGALRSHAGSAACVCVIPKQRSLRRRQNISIKMYQTVSRLFSISRCCLCCAWRGMLKWF